MQMMSLLLKLNVLSFNFSKLQLSSRRGRSLQMLVWISICLHFYTNKLFNFELNIVTFVEPSIMEYFLQYLNFKTIDI